MLPSAADLQNGSREDAVASGSWWTWKWTGTAVQSQGEQQSGR